MFFPTYNKPDCGALYRRALQFADNFDLLVIDAASDDGTTEILRTLSDYNPRFRLLIRDGNAASGPRTSSLGLMHRRIVAMDGDLSHDPKM